MIRHLFHVLGREASGPLKRLLALMVGAAVLQGVAFALLVPLLRTLFSRGPGHAWPWLVAFAGCSLGYAVVQALCLSQGFTVGSRISRVLHRRLADKALDLPVGWFTGTRAAELGRLASQNVIQVMNMPAHLLRPMISSVFTPVTLVLAAFLFDWRVGVVLLLCAPVLLGVHVWSTRMVRRLDRGRDTAIDESADRVLEFAQNQPVLRAFGRTVDGHADLENALRAESDADRTLIVRGVPGLVSFAFAARMVFALALALQVAWALDGTLAAPTLIALVVLTGRLVDSVSASADLGAGLRIARNNLERLDAVLEETPFPQPTDPKVPTGTAVEFDQVSFTYPKTVASSTNGAAVAPPAVLDGISLRLPERGLTALVGPSGAGKTTVARLLARFWDTTAGTVRIGGVDVRDIAPERLAATVAIVFQDVYLFDDTIEENVRIGAPDASAERIRRAAELSGMDRVVAELPDGWATRVGERGTALSGGQRQRISIARALLKDAPILVLDEATAALDPENEAILESAIAELAVEKSLLVIAHRLRTVLAADQILVLEGGRISEQGTHSELVDAGGTYSDFWRERTRAEGWRLAAR
ncbi:ABC transporter ATP-binding protein/permease [Actinoallomurus spadix]|uniref:ABC transporter ATP-binding protein n=1 Tax=Actinoallomurus spadix TaxID=79912 RepID=A0ABP3G333_9ACTN|nr:ABC transporter ATP-binding protein [Actinoallomurus spadix]MCO5987229.1 ABC transporter ATP-binding protein/permease [Actinoallomurus spadix]